MVRCRTTALPQYGMSRLIDRLVQAGLVERMVCPLDGRGQFVKITPAGWQLQKKMWEAYADAIQRHVRGKLSGRDAATLADLLGRPA